MKKPIVLSGGGAYGSYQIGVWKALRELNIKYDMISIYIILYVEGTE